ncbi:chemotaxis protein CheW [Cytophagaceae bacterium DM2B3-1]|uniref:Chemotaxis protein CheW n=1 Tax=Xanthocytophaga flava TaxID=3048013 RepID=A0ABT7CHY3_9BACT|nr:chemotaxis protein CheW [Xanthocytophaga flavus]MDJ1493146.1 chemotaxis protein CheW [Xanthocytophaga flavus]
MSVETASVPLSYLSFRLEEETFAVNVVKVIEILEVPYITRVPHTPDYISGIINLRGSVLPVIDTRIRFGLPPTDFTVNTCIVVLQVTIDNQSIVLGALVDSVQEVLQITNGQIKPPPSLGSKYRSEFLLGLVKTEEHFVMLLDMDQVFSAEELTAVSQSGQVD